MAPDGPISPPAPVPDPSDRPAVRAEADGPAAPLGLPRWLVLASLAVLVVFVTLQGSALFREWGRLRVESTRARDNVVIGYIDVAVNPSYAARPADWFRHEGEETLLWSGWRGNVGHGWFRVGRGEVDRARISLPIGRDVLRAIDHPLVEVAGGALWSRIPASAQVAGIELGGAPAVYPITLLGKVQVVNDRIGDRALLVAFDPLTRRDRSVSVYDPVRDRRRLTMGMSGYAYDGKPLLYDRGTESLWLEVEEGLRAIAGRLKGTTLRRLARPAPTSWGDWVARHPRSRLVVGADRSQPKPES